MQKTIGRTVTVSGIGLHSGSPSVVQLRPAPVGTGVCFRRKDLENFEIQATRQWVSRVVLATTLMKRGVMISTVEHLLSALYGLGVDNIFIDIDSLEVPILDGSALPWVEKIQAAGLQEQTRERTCLVVEKSFRIEEQEKYIDVHPYPGFRVSYEIEFEHPVIGYQRIDMEVTPQAYASELAFARTFGFYDQVETLLKQGLIRGGNLENAVVLSDRGILSGEIRRPDEFVRHKTLDLIGDLSLCGYPVLGHIHAFRAGHALHTRLATELCHNHSLSRKIRESEIPQAFQPAASAGYSSQGNNLHEEHEGSRRPWLGDSSWPFVETP